MATKFTPGGAARCMRGTPENGVPRCHGGGSQSGNATPEESPPVCLPGSQL